MKTDKHIPEIISDLISKDLLGLLDQEQQEELNRLCNEYHIREEEREGILARLETKDSFNAGAAYRQFSIKTGRRSIYRHLSVAAAVVLLLGISGLAYFYLRPVEPEVIPMAKEIEPGKSKATITLASGEKIELENLNRRLQETDGTHLQAGSGELVYEESGSKTELIYNTIDIPRGGEYRLVLSDGTKVWLNSETQLKYPVHFSGDVREVFLKGEAYFEVTHNEKKRFIVSTSMGEIQVLGTSFNVRDYQDENRVVTTLETGQVRYVSGKHQVVDLIPGYMLEDCPQGIGVPQKVNTTLYTGWKDGKYIFDDVSVEEIMQTLERWYDVKVFYANDYVKNLHFTGDLEKYATINTILNFMETGGDVRFSINGNTIIVGRK